MTKTIEQTAKVKRKKYFCIKDSGYSISVWPKDHYEIDIVQFYIAGITHRENIRNYLGEHKGTLEPEPTNPHDPNAIKVIASDGHHVGYVPKDMTTQVRKYFTLPCPCYFYIGKSTDSYYSLCYSVIS